MITRDKNHTVISAAFPTGQCLKVRQFRGLRMKK